MGIVKGYPRSKTRDMEMSPVKGSTPRAFDASTGYREGGTGEKRRDDDHMIKIKLGQIQNKKG